MKQDLHIKKLNDKILLEKFKKVLIITSEGHIKRGSIKKFVENNKIKNFIVDTVNPFPTLSQIKYYQKKYSKKNFDLIISLGGGSVIDVAKIMSVILEENNKFKLELNDFYNFKDIDFPKIIKHIAIPTTSGSGAEATSFATIWNFELKQKYSIENKSILPSDVLLDSTLLLTLNYENTLYSGLDALCHSIDTILNKYSNENSLKLSLDAIHIINDYFFDLLTNLNSYNLREEIQIASYKAGCAINFNKTSITHALSYPLTLNYNVPHGLACALFLEPVYEVFSENLKKESFHSILIEIIKKVKKLDLENKLKQYTSTIDKSYYNIKQLNNRIENFKYAVDNKSLNNIISKL